MCIDTLAGMDGETNWSWDRWGDIMDMVGMGGRMVKACREHEAAVQLPACCGTERCSLKTFMVLGSCWTENTDWCVWGSHWSNSCSSLVSITWLMAFFYLKALAVLKESYLKLHLLMFATRGSRTSYKVVCQNAAYKSCCTHKETLAFFFQLCFCPPHKCKYNIHPPFLSASSAAKRSTICTKWSLTLLATWCRVGCMQWLCRGFFASMAACFFTSKWTLNFLYLKAYQQGPLLAQLFMSVETHAGEGSLCKNRSSSQLSVLTVSTVSTFQCSFNGRIFNSIVIGPLQNHYSR